MIQATALSMAPQDAFETLSHRQRSVLATVDYVTERDGRPPTYRELAAEMGFSGANAVAGHLRPLRAKGMVTVSDGTARCVRLTDRYRQSQAIEFDPADFAHLKWTDNVKPVGPAVAEAVLAAFTEAEQMANERISLTTAPAKAKEVATC